MFRIRLTKAGEFVKFLRARHNPTDSYSAVLSDCRKRVTGSDFDAWEAVDETAEVAKANSILRKVAVENAAYLESDEAKADAEFHASEKALVAGRKEKFMAKRAAK